MNNIVEAPRVLLIEDNPDDALLLQELLDDDPDCSAEIHCVDSIQAAREALEFGMFHVILLDLTLPDSNGVGTIARVRALAPSVPIVILTGMDDRELATEAVRNGVQDFLVKGDANAKAIQRVLRYAIIRHRAEAAETKLKLIEQREYFIAALAHDLRTPLVAAQRIVTALLDGLVGSLAPPQMDLMQRLHTNNESVLMMLNNLLELYRLDSGAQTLVYKQTNLAELAEKCVAEFSELFRNKDLVVTTNWHGETVASVDEFALRRVFQNLLSNAIKFTPEGGQIAISSEDLGDTVVIRFSDDGCGMQEDQLASVFDRFYQTEKEYRGIGLGIGLHLCKRLVEAQRGSIACESRLGVGTTFEISLLKAASEKASPRVLIVEDNRTNQVLLSTFLKRFSVVSDVVENGFDAIAATRDSSYDAIFLDLRMPEMDGFATAKALRSAGVKIPIIAYTAFAGEEEKLRFHDVGINDILEKPIDHSRLQHIVARIASGLQRV